jgi:hypothetical protein
LPRKAEAIVVYPRLPVVVASVATTGKGMFVLALGDGRDEHYTYPTDGRFHATIHGTPSLHSALVPGSSFDDLAYQELARIKVPVDPHGLVRKYHPSTRPSMTITAPRQRDGILAVGIAGREMTDQVLSDLSAEGAYVAFFQGPRSDTTIVFRYFGGS